MCGICGYIATSRSYAIDEKTLRSMCRVMEHRGPNDEGIFLDLPLDEGKYLVGLGHRRLSIIDLTSQGHQPMSNEDGTVWIVYNGEVYNFIELKAELIQKGHVFKSHTDTEVVLHLYEEHGKDCVNYLRGMFSFVVWDSKTRILFAARDRLGVKPFYYYYDSTKFIFASEAKSILRSRRVDAAINQKMIDSYLSLNYVPAPASMFKDISKLLPGHLLIFKEGEVLIEKYWDMDSVEKSPDRGEKYFIEQFMSMLEDCVRMRLISDVPLGVFLSGGIDSSTVVALMSKLVKGQRVKTFCVGYKDKQSSELAYARIVAKKFNTDHHEFCLEPTEFYDFIPKLVWYFDEPVVEAAAIPLYFISKLAREHVTVLLSGEGADELLGGYPIYNYMGLIERYRKIPAALRKFLCDPILGSFIHSEKKLKKYLRWVDLPIHLRYRGVSAEIADEQKNQLYSVEFKEFINRAASVDEFFLSYYERVKDRDFLTKMLYLDSKVWLADELLIKADRMSMAASVELRVPFLDYKLVEMAMSIPSKYKIRYGINKHLLKKGVRKLLPSQIVKRRKRGFPVPINAWFKEDFSQKAAEILLDQKSLKRGYFNRDYIENIIKIHKSGKEDYSKFLFSLILLEEWHRAFLDDFSIISLD